MSDWLAEPQHQWERAVIEKLDRIEAELRELKEQLQRVAEATAPKGEHTLGH